MTRISSEEILVIGCLRALPLTRTSTSGSHKAIRAGVRLLDAPNIPLLPHCAGINNNDNISNPQIAVTEVPFLSWSNLR